MMSDFCKTCDGDNFPSCEECGSDSAEPIYARFDENGKPWAVDARGDRVRRDGDPG